MYTQSIDPHYKTHASDGINVQPMYMPPSAYSTQNHNNAQLSPYGQYGQSTIPIQAALPTSTVIPHVIYL